MEGSNKVTVRIFGQEYTIAGNVPEERMLEVAGYVDKMMTEINRTLPSLSTLSLAVLSSVNIASDLYESNRQVSELEQINADLQKQQDDLVKLWEDAKQTLLRYKDESANSVEQLQELQRIFNAKNVELNQVKEQLEEMTAQYQKAQEDFDSSQSVLSEMSEMESRYQEEREQAESYREEARALRKELDDLKRSRRNEDIGLEAMQDKYKELENSFFDIQMENINLKNELDELRKK
ncbi:MAG: cell division protein ZapA [Firmicutes bacterium]|nr:cell division protein ZapA [Bacillota bacterium]